MDELLLLVKHSKVLTNGDLDELKESEILLEDFKNISLVKIYQGEKVKTFDELIYTLNLFLKYEVDLYEDMINSLINDYLLKLKCDNEGMKKALPPILDNVMLKLESKHLYNYIVNNDCSNLTPIDIFRSVELFDKLYHMFDESVFTSKVVAKGLSYVVSNVIIKEMFTLLSSHPFNVIYEDLIESSIDRDNVNLLIFLLNEYNDRKPISSVVIEDLNNSTCMDYSAFKGSLTCLKYLHKFSKWDEWTCSYASRSGNLHVLKYLHEQGGSLVWDKWSCMNAAENGHLDCLKYLHENGCEWDKWTYIYASERGNLECLQYAKDHGCPC